jgi:hypothetical protein
MNWEQKLTALHAIADVSLRMRKPGDRHIYSRGKRVRWNGFMWQEVSP